jgi:hypothetical protein
MAGQYGFLSLTRRILFYRHVSADVIVVTENHQKAHAGSASPKHRLPEKKRPSQESRAIPVAELAVIRCKKVLVFLAVGPPAPLCFFASQSILYECYERSVSTTHGFGESMAPVRQATMAGKSASQSRYP